jgi:hypothetical protein
MTDIEKIEKVELHLDGGHTKPPHTLWFPENGIYKKGIGLFYQSFCRDDKEQVVFNPEGICEKCVRILNDKRR